MIEMITSVCPDFYLYSVVTEKVKDIEIQLAILKQLLKDIEHGSTKTTPKIQRHHLSAM